METGISNKIERDESENKEISSMINVLLKTLEERFINLSEGVWDKLQKIEGRLYEIESHFERLGGSTYAVDRKNTAVDQ